MTPLSLLLLLLILALLLLATVSPSTQHHQSFGSNSYNNNNNNNDDDGSTTTCSALNAINQQIVDRHYENFLNDMHPLNDGESIITAQLWDTVDLDTMIPDRHGSVLSRVELNTRRSFSLFATDDKDTKVHKDAKLGSTKTTVFGTSNVIEIDLGGEAEEKRKRKDDGKMVPTDQRVVVAFNVPVYESGPVVKSQVRFVVFDPWIDAPVTNLTVDDSYLFRYPLNVHEPDYEEPIYDSHGQVVGHQETAKEEAQWIDTDADQFQLQVRALRSKEPAKTIDFLVLIQTQESLKLVKYRINEDRSWTNIWAKLVVPRVRDVFVGAALGGILDVTEDNRDIFVTIPVHKSQKNAVAVHLGRDIDFPDGAEQVPFLLKFDTDSGSLVFVHNLSKQLNVANSHITLTDIKENHLILSGNSYEEGETTRPFFVRVTLDPDTRTIVSKVDAAFLDHVVTEDERIAGDMQFTAMSIAFSIGGSTDRFVVGGKVFDSSHPYRYQGRLALMSIGGEDTSKAEVIYRMRVGERGSNAVQIIRRSVRTDGGLFLGLMLDLPTTPPPADPVDDKFRNTHIGFWNVDCQLQDEKLEKAVTIGFFSFFGIMTSLLIVVVTTYSAIAIVRFIRSRQH